MGNKRKTSKRSVTSINSKTRQDFNEELANPLSVSSTSIDDNNIETIKETDDDDISNHNNKRIRKDNQEKIILIDDEDSKSANIRNKFQLIIDDDIKASADNTLISDLSPPLSPNPGTPSLNIQKLNDQQKKIDNAPTSITTTTQQIPNSQQDLITEITQQTNQSNNNIITLLTTFIQLAAAASPNISPTPINLPNIRNTTTTPHQSRDNDLINLYINECKTLFIRIRKPTMQLILALARECANHLGVTVNASDAKKKGGNWFSTWRTRLYDDSLNIAFNFMDRFECTSDKLPNEKHMGNFISNDDVIHIFESQLKSVKKDELINDQESWAMLKNYILNVVLIMVKHYVKINVDRTRYEAATSINRSEWRSTILVDLHNLDRRTADVNVTCEGGTKVAKKIDIKAFMNW